MFDPTVGRWLEEDPEGFDANDPNLFRYVKNNPLNHTDPSGLKLVVEGKEVKQGDDVYKALLEMKDFAADKAVVQEILDVMIQSPVEHTTYSFLQKNMLLTDIRKRLAIIHAAERLSQLEYVNGHRFVRGKRDTNIEMDPPRPGWEVVVLRSRNTNFRGLQYTGDNPAAALRDLVRQPEFAAADQNPWLWMRPVGKPYLYYECNSATVLVILLAELEVRGDEAFNKLFTKDKPLAIASLPTGERWWDYPRPGPGGKFADMDRIPGDGRIFENPDADDPAYLSENTIYLGGNRYFGHPLGIKTREEMIQILNDARKPNAKESAKEHGASMRPPPSLPSLIPDDPKKK